MQSKGIVYLALKKYYIFENILRYMVMLLKFLGTGMILA